MTKHEYVRINETLYSETLDNGLRVFLLPKKEFHKTYVTFSTRFGSIMTKIKDKDNNIIELPQGAAHFLEHKLFERKEGDISTLFAENQAHVNAYTQNNRTTYLFSCTDKLYENIDLLLNFVQFPIFTEKGINKEKGVITQEIKMYEDDPNTVAYMKILKNMFEKHPVRNDILGSVKSINEINIDNLTKTHQTFYNPNNMVLFATGNFDVDELMIYIKENQKDVFMDTSYTPYENNFLEDNISFVKEDSINLEVRVPNFLLGIKQYPTNLEKENLIKKELSMSILLDLVIGSSSSNYQDLLHKGLINDSFGTDISFEKTYGYFLIGSETHHPKDLNKEFRKIFLNLDSFIIDEKDFQRTKKQILGGFIHALNRLESIAHQFTKYYCLGTSIFSILDIANEISIEDINYAKKYFSNKDSYTSFTVYPKENDA